MKIKNVTLPSNVVLAPMAGFTDCGFRYLCSSFGCGLTTTEMVSAKGLLYMNDGSKSLLNCDKSEKPKAVQIFSNEPDVVAEVIKRGTLKDFDIIDINMGCPMPKVVKEGMGSALLKDFKTASEVIKSVEKNTKQPVTVKFRIGFDAKHIVATDFAKMCEDSGASAVCVHGRTKTQLYTGLADWNEIQKVKESVKIPVIGNGDVLSFAEAEDKMKNFGVDGVAIGRAALGKPWIFSKKYDHAIPENVGEIIRKHFQILQNFFPEKLVLLHMRKHLACYVQKIPHAKQIRHKLVTSDNLHEVLEIIDKLFIN